MENTIHHISKWAKTRESTAISLFYFGADNLLDLTRPLLLIGGVHGDEPEGVYLAEETHRWLTQLPLSQLSKTQPWVLIPCLNPDGYAKNTRTNSAGVDLNRNFPSQNWSSKYEKDRYYPGPHANSEPEVSSLVELIHRVRPHTIIHFHSWKPCIVVSGPSHLEYGKYLSDSTGFEIVRDIGYPTPGSLSSFAWKDHQIPVICTEDFEHRRREEVWPRFGSGVINCLMANNKI